MKKVLLVSMLVVLFSFTSCTKQKEKDIKKVDTKVENVKKVDTKVKNIKKVDTKVVSEVEKNRMCQIAMIHIIDLTFKTPSIVEQIKKDPTFKEKMLKKIEDNRDKSIKKCVDQFNQKSMNCILDAKDMPTVVKCASIK